MFEKRNGVGKAREKAVVILLVGGSMEEISLQCNRTYGMSFGNQIRNGGKNRAEFSTIFHISF